MSSPRRHGLPKKKPASPAKDDIAAELPELEPIDDAELPLLEPIEDAAAAAPVAAGPVKATCGPAGESGFDLAITVEVAAMDKKAVADAVQGPLQRAVDQAAAQLRFQRVLVRFTGEAMVGSAIKELVAGILKPKKPLKVTVRRGFGDELVFEGALPKLGVDTQSDGATTKVTFATAELEAADLPPLLAPELAKLAAGAKGRKFVFTFQGGAKPDAALRDTIGKALEGAGALRAAIGERVLFDRELADRVKVAAAGGGIVVTVTPASDALVTQEALHMVLPAQAAQLAGKSVRVHFVSEIQPAERALCLDLVRKAGPQRLEVGDGKAEAEVVWPKLLELVPGNENVLRVQTNGRSRGALLAAFRSEVGEHAGALKGKAVVVDWPAGFAVDAAVETALAEGLGGAKAVVCTVGGEQREPFLPAPVAVGGDGELRTVRLDTDAGKPAELTRAIERRLPAVAGSLRGKTVRVQIAGSAAPSRTLLRTLCGAIESAGCTRLELEDRGTIDVLMPPLLTISKGQDGVRIAAVAAGRDPGQLVQALQRELDAAELAKGASFTLGQSTITEALVTALVARGAGRVLLDGNVPVQVHPPLFAAPERKGERLTLRAAPVADAAITGKMLERELPGVLAAQKDLEKAVVVLVWAGASEPLAGPVATAVGKLVERKVREVQIDAGNGKPFQVHPPVPVLELEPETAPAAPATAVAPAATPRPASAPAAAGGELLSVLGRLDEAVPPMLLLGVEAGSDDAHVAAVQQQLQDHLVRFSGRCVMLILRSQGQDVPVRRPEPLVAMLGQVVASTAAATLVFRGPDAQGRPHFQVLHSTLRALPRGATFGDPRQRR